MRRPRMVPGPSPFQRLPVTGGEPQRGPRCAVVLRYDKAEMDISGIVLGLAIFFLIFRLGCGT